MAINRAPARHARGLAQRGPGSSTPSSSSTAEETLFDDPGLSWDRQASRRSFQRDTNEPCVWDLSLPARRRLRRSRAARTSSSAPRASSSATTTPGANRMAFEALRQALVAPGAPPPDLARHPGAVRFGRPRGPGRAPRRSTVQILGCAAELSAHSRAEPCIRFLPQKPGGARARTLAARPVRKRGTALEFQPFQALPAHATAPHRSAPWMARRTCVEGGFCRLGVEIDGEPAAGPSPSRLAFPARRARASRR